MTKSVSMPKIIVFTIFWVGQIISLVGSGITGFALGISIYEKTGSTTQLALISLFSTLPGIVLSPIIGVLIDRWQPRLTMIFSSCVAAAITLCLALLFLANKLNIWYIYFGVYIISICSAFQNIANTVAITLIVPKQHLGRASGMLQIGEASSRLFSPALAGVLVLNFKIQGVLLIDFITYLFATATLLIVQFPKTKIITESTESNDNNKDNKNSILFREAFDGWNYIVARPGLLGLLIFFAIGNFVLGMASILITPMLLAFTSAAVLGNVLSIGGSGMLIGTIVMSVWGGPKNRIYGMFYFGLLQGIFIIFIGLRPLIPLITLACFSVFFTIPIINGCSQAIWQTKVPKEMQGRVFATRRMVSWLSFPLAYVLAGPLADYVFEPLLAVNSPLASNVGKIIGVGAGRGIGLLFVVLGALTFVAVCCSYFYKSLRFIEKELPDVV
ncbi:major facilitator superfamily MFS_1 [Calothrix sp. NIES-4071]|nr:major facilitator superfamily MFS_1 [Calothrix sp. NIES-4071]BAZ56073.1 major facilitator superfamily MFS_1 [Calothrix sp. NIES-4105]